MKKRAGIIFNQVQNEKKKLFAHTKMVEKISSSKAFLEITSPKLGFLL